MAGPYYVRSGAAGAGTGADWANAYTTLTTAFSGKVAGDVFYVSEDHAESTGSAITLTSPGTTASPSFVYCVNHAGTVPPVSADLRTTATVTTTGAFAISFGTAFTYFYGIQFNCGTGAVTSGITIGTSSSSYYVFESCAFSKLGTSANTSAISLGNALNVTWINCTAKFGNTGDSIAVGQTKFLWKNTASAIAGATFPTSLFGLVNAQCSIITLDGVDLSALGSGKTIFANSITNPHLHNLINCKLGASVTIASTPGNRNGPVVTVIDADSSATNYQQQKFMYEGTLTPETTIVRTGGATDGATPLSHKIVTTANSKWLFPFVAFPLTIWNDLTAAITTLTIYGTTTGGGVPNNDDIWVEVEYLGSSLTPQASFITSSKADNLAASVTTNNSADASIWGGGGAGNGFKIVVPSFTPGMLGPLNITVKVAKVSSTYYIDPKVVVT